MSSLKTKKYLIRLEKKGQHIPLDPLSVLYRICPQCAYEFMAEDAQDVYCCTKCKDDFHNAIKKLKSSNQLVETEYNQTDQEKSESYEEENLQRNIEILWEFDTDDPDGTQVAFEDLDARGFDFNCNNGQGLLYNTPESIDCHFVVYGPFHLYWITFGTALIVNPLKS